MPAGMTCLENLVSVDLIQDSHGTDQHVSDLAKCQRWPSGMKVDPVSTNVRVSSSETEQINRVSESWALSPAHLLAVLSILCISYPEK